VDLGGRGQAQACRRKVVQTRPFLKVRLVVPDSMFISVRLQVLIPPGSGHNVREGQHKKLFYPAVSSTAVEAPLPTSRPSSALDFHDRSTIIREMEESYKLDLDHSDGMIDS